MASAPPGAYGRGTGAVAPRRPRLAFDGLPRALNLGAPQRRALRAEARRWLAAHPKEAARLTPKWSALIPAAVMLAVLLPFQTLVFIQHKPFPAVLLLIPMLPLQIVVSFWLLRRAQWPAMARAFAAIGHEVGPACGFDLCSLSRDEHRCPECGTARDLAPGFPGTLEFPPRPTLTAQAGDHT